MGVAVPYLALMKARSIFVFIYESSYLCWETGQGVRSGDQLPKELVRWQDFWTRDRSHRTKGYHHVRKHKVDGRPMGRRRPTKIRANAQIIIWFTEVTQIKL
jgi:hypothetical protein